MRSIFDDEAFDLIMYFTSDRTGDKQFRFVLSIDKFFWEDFFMRSIFAVLQGFVYFS